ncbi:MAG: SDR family oxidoreductase [Candidatus Pacebacteria bacterium]|nr:SDR family oxidoreductase [Candidatus Paceibacterota bacterium]
MNLQGKVVLITGASDGIGKQIALRLAVRRVKLALLARRADALQKVADEAKKLGAAEARIYPCDVVDTKKLSRAISSIIHDFGVLDILINNAGIWQKKGRLDTISQEVVDQVIGIDLTAVIHCTRLTLPHLLKQPEAAIINISSRSGTTAQMGQSIYSAAKWGVHGFTEVLKEDLKGTSVRVAGVYQGGINTTMFQKAGEEFSTVEFTEPYDLAEVVVFMLSQPQKIWLHDVRVER